MVNPQKRDQGICRRSLEPGALSFHLDFASPVNFLLYSQTGRVVFESGDISMNAGTTTVTLGTVAPGKYIIQIRTSKGVVIEKAEIH